MFYIIKFMLIILLNETCAYITQDIETIMLPVWKPTGAKEMPLTLKVFGQLIQLNLRRNKRIVLPKFQVWKYNAKSVTENLWQLNVSNPCYYYHEDDISSATINFCHKHGLEGFLFLKNDTLQIRPLRNGFAHLNLIDDICIKEQVNLSFGKLHLIKRSVQYLVNSTFHNLGNLKQKRHYVENTERKLTLKLAVFLDEAAYIKLMPFLNNDIKKLLHVILVYVNRIQTAFHHPSLGVSVDISYEYLQIMDKQPTNLQFFNGNAHYMYTLFCEYANTYNFPIGDKNHWDVSLYLTGINIYITHHDEYSEVAYSFKKGAYIYRKYNMTFYSCAIVEFGATYGDVSASFTSALIAAREIGYILGMSFDSDFIDSTTCPSGKYIMSDIKYHRGQVTWSECSRKSITKQWETGQYLDYTKPENCENLSELDHSRYHDLPGREWTAKAQCELFLRDKDANVVTLHDICQVLQCETPHKNEYFFAGPALDGTHCTFGKECHGGECVPVIEPPYIFNYCEETNWSEWKEDSCKSNCLTKSKGVIIKRRSCKRQTNKMSSCDGLYYNVDLCDDHSICTEERRTIEEYATMKCIKFEMKTEKISKKHFKDKSQLMLGQQGLYDVRLPWKSCSVLCRQKENTTYRILRLEMLDLGIDPYFPDGTWCHEKDGQNYYCRQHYCLPENY